MTMSIRGYSYILLIIDHGSNFCYSAYLRSKESYEVSQAIIRYIAMIERQCSKPMEHINTRVKVMKSDCGNEFKGHLLNEYFEKNGIIHERSAPYASQQNGKIERQFQTIKGSARTMMLAEDVPDYLWTESISTAVYLKNRILNSVNTEKTAYEIVFGRKPHLAHLRVFGCVCFIRSRKIKGMKQRGLKRIFVGYDQTSRNYRVYDKVKRQFDSDKHVKFCENTTDNTDDNLIIKNIDANTKPKVIPIQTTNAAAGSLIEDEPELLWEQYNLNENQQDDDQGYYVSFSDNDEQSLFMIVTLNSRLKYR